MSQTTINPDAPPLALLRRARRPGAPVPVSIRLRRCASLGGIVSERTRARGGPTARDTPRSRTTRRARATGAGRSRHPAAQARPGSPHNNTTPSRGGVHAMSPEARSRTLG